MEASNEPPNNTYIQVQIPNLPYSAVRFPIGSDYEWIMAEIVAFGHAYRAVWPKAEETQEAAPAPAQGGSRSSGGQSRADKYPLLEGRTCDQCNGPVGRYPKTGAMRTDKAVCLGRCMDGKFVYSVGWLDDEPEAVPAGQPERDEPPPPEEPF
jgi:hypothetical protein